MKVRFRMCANTGFVYMLISIMHTPFLKFCLNFSLFPIYIYKYSSLSYVLSSLLYKYRVCVHVDLHYAHTCCIIEIDMYNRDHNTDQHVQPIAFGVSFNLNLQSQSPWSLFNGTW